MSTDPRDPHCPDNTTAVHCSHWQAHEGRCCWCGVIPPQLWILDPTDEDYCPEHVNHRHCACWYDDLETCCACDAPGPDMGEEIQPQ